MEQPINKQPMEHFQITADMVKHQVKKIKNWTALGKDEVHGYWLKHLTSLHTRIAKQLNHLLQTVNGSVSCCHPSKTG